MEAPMFYSNLTTQAFHSAHAALAWSWVYLLSHANAIVLIKDASGQVAYRAECRGSNNRPMYRRWRGESFTGWTTFPLRTAKDAESVCPV